MNRFERLFFILEKNPAEPLFANRDVGGVVKIILTAEQIRVMWEVNSLPLMGNTQYAIAVFFQRKGTQTLQPVYCNFQPNTYGNVRMETILRQSLQEGETILGVGLSVLEQKDAKRKFPLVAFQDMQVPWQSMLQGLTQIKEPPKEIKREHQRTRAEHMAELFVPFDPFGTTNAAYRWWKSTDMHTVNQALAQINMTLPLELNKEVYLACGHFGRVLLGLYTDPTLQREFFILGIPAKRQTDSGNYYSHSRWEPLGQQVLSQQEESGYWLTYMDCNTAKVVKVV